MDCIYCSSPTQVTNTRRTNKGLSTWRRRRCIACQAEWTTRENIDLTTAIRIKDNQANLKPFNSTMLLISIYESLKHRKTALRDAEALTQTVTTKLLATQNAIWPTSLIIQKTLDTLAPFDSTAAALYRALHSE